MSILRDLLTPEAQRDGHHWSATAAGHCWLGIGIWGGLAVIFDRWTGAVLAPMLYFLMIEGMQLAFAKERSRRLVWDSVLDTVAVAFGCIAGACTRDGNLNGAMAAWGASIAVIAAGWIVRR